MREPIMALTDESNAGPRNPASPLWWMVPALTVVLLLVFGMLFEKSSSTPITGSSHDPSATGLRAAYLLLEELGYPVKRSRRRPGSGTGTAVFWALQPTTAGHDAVLLEEWVRDGGVLVLADAAGELSRALQLPIKVEQRESQPSVQGAAAEDVRRIFPGWSRVRWTGPAGDVWATIGDEPLVSFHPLGRGEVCVVHRPDCFANDSLKAADQKGADNGILLCRLADEVQRRRPGRMVFDDYFHGLRDRPDFVDLLLRPPTLWVTLQALLLLLFLLWQQGPRFGTARPQPAVRRRSKEEYLDAMAELLDRKADYADAFRTARDSLRRDLEAGVGLPHDAPVEEIVRLVVRLRPDLEPSWQDRLPRLLLAGAPPGGAGKLAFVAALTDLETVREDFFRGRHPH
jgi:hypothetical protein